MWNYLKGKLRIGIPPLNLYMWVVTLFADAVALNGLVSALFGLTKTPILGIFLFLFMGAIGGLLTYSSIQGLKTATPVPYWGEHFGKDAIFKLLAEDEFSPYITKEGYECSQVKISKSRRWIKIAGRYYPIPLIVGVNRSKTGFTFIDGEYAQVHGMKGTVMMMALEELFPPLSGKTNPGPYDDVYSNLADAFKLTWDKDYAELAHADWFEVRYRWERNYAALLAEMLEDDERQMAIEELTDENVVYRQMFSRALYNDEILEIANAVIDNKLKKPYLLYDINNYVDESCIYNGIKLLDAMGYPANKDGINFLFDCIRNVQKSYCDDAIRTLAQKYPRELLIEHIDADIEKAHEENNLLWAAGLIALSKEIDYKIILGADETETEAEALKAEVEESEVREENELKGFTLNG